MMDDATPANGQETEVEANAETASEEVGALRAEIASLKDQMLRVAA